MPIAPLSPSLDSTLASTSAPSRPHFARGTALGRYLVLGLLGEGGMGAVYAAYDPELDRKVAVKMLKVRGGDPAAARARLLREAQAMARVSHPNVLSVFDAGVLGEELFIAMELVEGEDLSEWLSARPRTPREILEAFCAAGRGLAAAHAAGLVHRDFKPQNVLVGRDGRVRVTDFGLAHLDEAPAPVEAPRPAAPGSNPTLAGQVAGTPAYMAPEQFLGAATDARADQFAFCVALWEALAGERPCAGESLETIRASVLEARLRPGNPARLGRRLRLALLRGLALRPEERHPDLATLLRALESQLARRWPYAAAALALVGVAGAAGVAGWEWTRCGREAAQVAAQGFGPQRRATVASRLASAKLRHPEFALERLDGFFAEWAQSRRGVCQALRSGRSCADDALAARCLDHQALRADAVVRALAQPGDASGPALERVIDRLPSPAACLAARARPADAPELPDLKRQVEDLLVLHALSRNSEVAATGGELLEQAVRLQAHSEAAQLRMALAGSQWEDRGASEEVVGLLRQAIRDADSAGDDALGLSARTELASFLLLGLDRPAEAATALEDAEAWLRRLGSPKELDLELAAVRGNLLVRTGEIGRAVDEQRRRLALVQQVRGPRSSAELGAAIDLAMALSMGFRFVEAGEVLERALAGPSAELASVSNLAIAWTNLAIIRVRQGRLDDALRCLDRCDQEVAPVREEMREQTVWAELFRAQVLELSGEHVRALALLEEQLAQGAALRPADRAEALASQVRALLASGRAERTLPLAREAVELSSQGDAFTIGSANWALAQALAAAGDRPAAQAATDRALEEFARPEDAYLRGRVEGWRKAAWSGR